MMDKREKGIEGETKAVAYLRKQGYEIICQNWRYKHLEIDIIARESQTLVFVEVKTRSYTAFGLPYEAVSPAKQAKLARAANLYITASGYEGEIRFDVVSVISSGKTTHDSVRLIRDAFWPE